MIVADEVHELLDGALVLEGVGRDPDRHTVAHFFFVGRSRPARTTANWIGFSTLVSRTFSSPSATRRIVLPGANGTNGFLTRTSGVERVVLLAELGLREPGPDAELPEVGASRMDQEIAVDLETQLHRPLRPPPAPASWTSRLDIGVIERERAALPRR